MQQHKESYISCTCMSSYVPGLTFEVKALQRYQMGRAWMT